MQPNITDAIVKGILVGLFMAISVGPTLFAVIRYSITYSYKAGLAFVLGVSVSDIMFVTLSNVAAQWLERLRPYEKYIGIGGGLVLVVIGIAGLIKKQQPVQQSEKPLPVSGNQYAKIWLGGFLVNTLNPGALITWLGAVTLIADKPPLYRFILFGTGLIIILGVDFSKVFLAGKIKNALTPKRISYVQRFSALCLLLIGIMITVTTILNSRPQEKGKKSEIDKILSYASAAR